MFGQNNSPGNYLITSNESLIRKEDRILNREYGDPYRYEKKIDYIYQNESNNNKFNLNNSSNNPCDSLGNSPQKLIDPSMNNLNFNYNESNNIYKRRENSINNNLNNPDMVNTRYKTKKEMISAEFSNLITEDLLSLSPNDNNNYNQELNYYRDMIENMHNEIGNLNSKLNDLEKHNSRQINSSRALSHSNSVSNASTGNFKSNRVDLLEKNIETLKQRFELNMKLKDEQLRNLEKEREYLYNKSNDNIIRDNKLKIGENDKDLYKFNTLIQYNNDLNAVVNFNNIDEVGVDSTINKNLIPVFPKKENSETTKSVKPEVTNMIKKKNKVNSRSADKIKKNSISEKTKTKKSDSKSINKNNKIPLRKHKSNLSIGSNVSNASNTDCNSKISLDILHENELLKNKISSLEKTVKSLTDHIALDNIEKKGKDHLRVELEIWKNRSESIANNYFENINTIKKQLANDKIIYIDQYKSLQYEFNSQISNLKNKYQTLLESNENTIKRLKKENEDLKKKVFKVKEILTPINNK